MVCIVCRWYTYVLYACGFGAAWMWMWLLGNKVDCDAGVYVDMTSW